MTTETRNNYIKRAILCVVFAALLAGILFYAMRVLERKDSMNKNGTFFTEAAAGHIDGLLLGSSHVVNGINSAQIYEESGYTVYNLAGQNSIMPVSYWTLVNALDYCSPEYVFIDTYFMEQNYHYLDIRVDGDYHDTENAVDLLHTVLDCFPNSANKRAAIADLIYDEDTRAEFQYDFIKYHSRWSSLNASDFREAIEPTNSALMGTQLRYDVYGHVQTYDLLPAEEVDDTDTVGKQYLRRIIELCLARDITPVIIQVPFEASDEEQRMYNSAALIAEEYGIPFVNMRYVPDIINTYSDLQSQSHLSAYGAYKVTRYFAENTLRELGMTDHRGDDAYQSWEDSVQEWHQEVWRIAQSRSDLRSMLMKLQFDDVSAKVIIRDGSALYQDDILVQELQDLPKGSVLSASEVDGPMLKDFPEFDPGADVQIYVYDGADGKFLQRHVWTDVNSMVE